MADDLTKALQRIRTARYAEAERTLKEHGIHERPDFPHGIRLYVDDRFPHDIIGVFTAEGEQLIDLRKKRPTDDH
mgnify:CR=1 FL=1